MSRNFLDFYNDDPESKLINWGVPFGLLSVAFFGTGLIFIFDPGYILPNKWLNIEGLNYAIGIVLMFIAIYEIRVIIKTGLVIKDKKK